MNSQGGSYGQDFGTSAGLIYTTTGTIICTRYGHNTASVRYKSTPALAFFFDCTADTVWLKKFYGRFQLFFRYYEFKLFNLVDCKVKAPNGKKKS